MGTWEVDLASGAVSLSAGHEALFGLPPGSFPGTEGALFEAVHPDDLETVKQSVCRAAQEKAAFEVEFRTVWPNGSVHWLAAKGRPFFDENGQAVQVVGVGMNIDERRRGEADLLETNRRLEETLAELQRTQQQIIQQERLRAMGQMASGIAHDFNNALSMILGHSELLLCRPETLDDKSKALAQVQTINAAARDASQVVGRLREFYRPREEDEPLGHVDVRRLVERAVSVSQPKWRDQALARGATIAVETDCQEVPLVAGNDAELSQALTNLIFNAVDAMPDGGTLTIRTCADSQRVTLQVRDTGVGMTCEVRQRCLEPFFTTKGEDGTGLGLAGVVGVVQRHNGKLKVESQVAKGTTVTIKLPVAERSRSAPDAMSRDHSRAHSGCRASRTTRLCGRS